ncbi:uncharacterized protein LOC122301804 [Carya illinoinensis]|uniref:uncharacterized protein LOC122301804 n=1 Tax=Carya illinoinensis TaxID=32201 RepID=UPI001C71C065|nr:uncharacterized protein LOC122301804 [Carya illinoinensis]
METKLLTKKFDAVKKKLGCVGCFVVDARGNSGGLTLLWNQEVNLEVLNFTQHHISVLVMHDDGVRKWILTGFYGHPEVSKRSAVWSLLSSLKPAKEQGWCVIGDFNEIITQSEKVGGRERPEGQMEGFRQCLENCNLFDLGWKAMNTWSNQHIDDTFTKKRLDRAVANPSWLEIFKERGVETLIARQSDHKPILLTLIENQPCIRNRKRLFRFEAKWSLDEEGGRVVEDAWERTLETKNLLIKVQRKLKACSGDLLRWNSQKASDGEKEILRLSERLKMEQATESSHNVSIVRKLQKELEEEKNRISEIIDDQGRCVKDQKGIEEVFFQYYSNLSSPSTDDIAAGLWGIESKVSGLMNEELQKDFTMLEVEAALKDMGPLKSPGPDGFGACLYQNYWSTIGEEVCQAVLSFLNEKSGLDGSINFTHIALIPKIDKPVIASDFRPISLCNVLYKLVSKVLANRLKKVLPVIISKNQSAFLPGRLITDNVMVAYEALHTMKTRQKGRIGSMALKLDISKAYDRIEWGFLEAIMRKLGFGERWIRLVMVCVTSVTYSVLVNGQPCCTIKPSRGIRQGDPISPYLFILCAEGFSSLVDMGERRGDISGVAVTRGGIRVNHLLFADDSVIFGRAKLSEWFKIQDLLSIYERASRQSLNRQKTTIFFSSNTPMSVRRQIQQVAGVATCGNFEKYLGLPSIVGRSRYNTFRILKERVWNKVNNWKNTFLSQAGKEILLKAVVQAIPTYSMSVFMLPRRLCKEIVVVMAKFWWGHMQNDRRIHWRGWSRMGDSKKRGGLGFRELESFNKAMLAKQVWRMLNNPSSLVARVMKEKYFKRENLLEARLGRGPSLIWRSLWSSMSLIKSGLIWQVGRGNKIKVWKDKWIPSSSFHMVSSPVNLLDEDACVNQLIDGYTGHWKTELISKVFSAEDAEAICCIPLSRMGSEDRMKWGFSSNGLFSVRSAYHLEHARVIAEKGESSNVVENEFGWKSIWKLKVQGVVKHFLWKACHDLLPTRMNLVKRKIIDSSLCPICEREEESTVHALWSCPSASYVWAENDSPVKKWACSVVNFMELWKKLNYCLEEEKVGLVACTLRRIWLRRNAVIFEKNFECPKVLTSIAQQNFAEFSEANSGPKSAQVNRSYARWKKPDVLVCKFNWDAAIDATKKRVGVGIIVRDSDGEILACLCLSVNYLLKPACAEAYALRRAMFFCLELGCTDAVFEGDSLMVVKAANGEDEMSTDYSVIIEDTRKMLNNNGRWSVKFTHREANNVAHMLVKLALDCSDEIVEIFARGRSKCARPREGGSSSSTVKIDDFQDLLFDSRSLTSVFVEHSWSLVLDQRDEAFLFLAYIDIVTDFYRGLNASGQDVDYILSDFIGMAHLGIAYPNVVHRESATNEETVDDEGTDIDGLDGLSDAEVYRLVVGSDASPYDGM